MEGERIKDFLKKRQRELFDGCIKMVFEDGRLSLVTEASHLDFPMTKVFSQKTVSDLVAMTEARGFCGTLVFFFKHGEICFYSYARSYRGDSLGAIFGSDNKGGKRE